MLQIKIRHSFIVDVKIFFQTLGYKKWLDYNGYFYQLLGREVFRNIDYEKNIQEISFELNKYQKKLEQNISLNENYEIYLTKFGTFGSYELPNKVFANILRTPAQIAETIIHELVHLGVEKEVIKKRMTHAEKEAMVESMVEKILK